jgi:hypothetical protein
MLTSVLGMVRFMDEFEPGIAFKSLSPAKETM